MARFDLLDEYICVVVPKGRQSGASGEMARREASIDSHYGKSSWRHAIAMIVGLGMVLAMITTLWAASIY
jgi:hypothetical protein